MIRSYPFFILKGGYLRAYDERNKQNIGCKGIDFGGKNHFLDAMIILKPIWEYNEVKYSIVGGIKRCWSKSNILPVSWECDIDNNVGCSYVPIILKTITKDGCDHICNLIETLSLK